MKNIIKDTRRASIKVTKRGIIPRRISPNRLINQIVIDPVKRKAGIREKIIIVEMDLTEDLMETVIQGAIEDLKVADPVV